MVRKYDGPNDDRTYSQIYRHQVHKKNQILLINYCQVTNSYLTRSYYELLNDKMKKKIVIRKAVLKGPISYIVSRSLSNLSRMSKKQRGEGTIRGSRVGTNI